MVTFTEGVLVPGQISLALSSGHSPQVRPVDKTTGVGKNITRGQIIFLNATPDKFEVATSGSTSTDFGVATEDASESDPKVHAALEGTAVAVTLSGAVTANNDLKPNTGGTAIGLGGSETAGQICGFYLGHPKETDGRYIVTNGANLEVVYMLIRRK
jgi:hypothetical protein